MEDEVYDPVNQLYSYLPSYFQHFSLSMDIAPDITTGGGYGRWIFDRYLAEKFGGPTIIRNIWEQLRTISSSGADIPMVPVIDTVLQAKGSSFATELLGFGKRLYEQDWTTHVGDTPLIYAHPLVYAGTFSSFPTPSQTATLSHYAMSFYKFTPGFFAPSDLVLTFSQKPSTVSLLALKKSTGGVITEHVFDSTTSKIIVPSFANGGTAEVVLMVVNSGPADGQAVAFSTDGSVPPSTAAPAASGSSSHCFIATAAYGSYLHPKVRVLREFRDRYLLTNAPGRKLVEIYYRTSPPLADLIARHEALRFCVRLLLTPLVWVVEHPLNGTGLLLALFSIVLLRRRHCSKIRMD
jgi:hypothetical protein